MEEQFKRQCSKCKVFRSNEYFEEYRKLCNICIDAKQRYRQKHKPELSQKYKEYYNENKDDVLIKAKDKRERITFCSICNRDIKQYDIKRHINSKNHIEKMEAIQNKQP